MTINSREREIAGAGYHAGDYKALSMNKSTDAICEDLFISIRKMS